MEVGAIASGAMAMQTLQFQQSYAIAVTQKAMDAQELAGQEIGQDAAPAATAGEQCPAFGCIRLSPWGPGRRSR